MLFHSLTLFLSVLSFASIQYDHLLKIEWAKVEGVKEYEVEVYPVDSDEPAYTGRVDGHKLNLPLKVGEYKYRVRSVDIIERPGNWSEWEWLTVLPGPPQPEVDQKVILVRDGYPEKIEFSWQESGDAEKTQLQLKGPKDYRHLVAGSAATVPTPEPGRYELSLVAINGALQGPQSDAVEVEVKNKLAPAKIEVVSPQPNESVTPTPLVNMTWKKDPEANRYKVDIYKVNDETLEEWKSTWEEGGETAQLLPPGDYAIKVTGYDSLGEGAAGSEIRFNVDNPLLKFSWDDEFKFISGGIATTTDSVFKDNSSESIQLMELKIQSTIYAKFGGGLDFTTGSSDYLRSDDTSFSADYQEIFLYVHYKWIGEVFGLRTEVHPRIGVYQQSFDAPVSPISLISHEASGLSFGGSVKLFPGENWMMHGLLQMGSGLSVTETPIELGGAATASLTKLDASAGYRIFPFFGQPVYAQMGVYYSSFSTGYEDASLGTVDQVVSGFYAGLFYDWL